jgi:hypothetical protein
MDNLRQALTELEQLLSNCDATQLSMNICAFRDFVETDMALNEAVGAPWPLRRACTQRTILVEAGNRRRLQQAGRR